MDGLTVDTDVLRDVARRLERSAARVAGATPMSSAPDAGRSSGEVASARRHLDEHAENLARSLANAAAALVDNASRYDAQDAATAARLDRSGP